MKIVRTFLALPLLALLLNSCSSYGKKVNNGPIDVYYKEGIAEDQAKVTARILADIDRTQNNNTKDTKSFQLVKKNDTFCFRMVTAKGNADGVQENAFQALGNIVSDSVFNGAPVNVELTNNTFETIKTISYKKLVEPAPAQ